MADELKRVGLVFKEDGATDFKKTLQEVNTELNKNYNQFRLVQSQWNSSTTSTEKLRAQQEYLSNAYEIQQDKVNALRMELSNLENTEGTSTTAIKKKQNELTNAEIKLASYESQLKEVTNQLENFGAKMITAGKKVESAGDTIEKAGKKLSAFSTATATALVACTSAAIEFEDAFVGVTKTVDGTDEQLEEIKQGIIELSTEIPSTTTEIAEVAEAAGQLGIATEDILSFTEVMIDLGNATNLSADEAASALAKFANVTQMSADDYEKLGSTIVDLGNNFATTEADIVDMATNLAATGELTGLTQPQILALATAMSSVGIEAEAGGSAMSKLLKKIQVAVETGSSDLKSYASVANMTASEFKKAFEEDAVGALTSFISGLNDTERNGKSAISILNDMDLTEVRLSNTILSLANSSDVMTSALDTAESAWEDNTALTEEAEKRYADLKSQLEIAVNKVKALAITFGNKLTPYVTKATNAIEKATTWVENLTDEDIELILKIVKTVAVIGPLVTILGKVTSTAGKTISAIGTFTQAIGVASGSVTTTSVSVNKLASVISSLTSPAGLATIAVTALTAAVVAYGIKAYEEITSLDGVSDSLKNQKESWEELEEAKNETLETSAEEISSIENLVNELDKIVDENGKVKEGYANRASYILNELNSALGTEYSLNGDIIEQYQDMQSNIQQLIATKKAEALLDAYQEEYAEALKKEAEGTENLVSLKQQLADATNDYYTAENAIDQYTAKKKMDTLTKAIGEQTDMLSQYGYTIQNCENLQAAIASNSAEEIEAAVEQMGVSWKKAKTQSEESIAAQVNSQQTYVTQLKESLQKAQDANDTYQAYILQSQLDTAQSQLDTLVNSMTEQTSTVNELSQDEIDAWTNLANNSFTKYKSALSQLPTETQAEIEEATGVVALNSSLSSEMWLLGSSATGSFNTSLGISGATEQELADTATAIDSDTGTILSMEELTARMNKTYYDNADGETSGKNFVRGVSSGLTNADEVSKAETASGSLASRILAKFNSRLDEHSPSKESRKSAKYFIDGFILGIEGNQEEALETVDSLAQGINDEFDDNLEPSDYNVNVGKTGSTNYSINTEELVKGNEKIIELLTKILEKNGQSIVLDTGVLVGETVEKYDTALGNLQTRKERGS